MASGSQEHGCGESSASHYEASHLAHLRTEQPPLPHLHEAAVQLHDLAGIFAGVESQLQLPSGRALCRSFAPPRTDWPSFSNRLYIWNASNSFIDLNVPLSTTTQTSLAFARTWHAVSAQDRVLGPLAVNIAKLLMGKHKPIYDQSKDLGDYVVVTNAKQVVVTGRKADQRVYRHHTMYPGGLKEIKYKEMMERKPEEIIRKARLDVRLSTSRMVSPLRDLGQHVDPPQHLFLDPGAQASRVRVLVSSSPL
ncbi:hypothetical protein L1887_56955 [Cichorium endivia]|nr:hypothetical protein L1887_56955 [Cichorium endivia]